MNYDKFFELVDNACEAYHQYRIYQSNDTFMNHIKAELYLRWFVEDAIKGL